MSPADFSSLPCPSSTQDLIDPIKAEYHIVLSVLSPFSFSPASILNSSLWFFSPIQSFVLFLTLTCISDGFVCCLFCVYFYSLPTSPKPTAQTYLPFLLYPSQHFSSCVPYQSLHAHFAFKTLLCFSHQGFLSIPCKLHCGPSHWNLTLNQCGQSLECRDKNHNARTLLWPKLILVSKQIHQVRAVTMQPHLCYFLAVKAHLSQAGFPLPLHLSSHEL